MTFSDSFLAESADILEHVDTAAVESCVEHLAELRARSGRLFVLGVGGSAGHASHAVNDFRKLCQIEAYTPTDNVSELTARINDDGWDSSFSDWLVGSNLNERDGILVFSVGGGDKQRGVSANLVSAMDTARKRGAMVLAIVGRDGGYARLIADECVAIPPLYP
ncbi:MAG TPA: SIS domain-containing protein, partial [Acidimicrobiales bacterium]|nr:SIS domain-containing protein [Acidimicrobiales bacterium]